MSVLFTHFTKPAFFLLFTLSVTAATCQVNNADTSATFKGKSNVLPNVTVNIQKQKNAGKIMKRVVKNMEKNYGSPSYNQKFTVEELTRNYDTTESNITYILSQHYFEDQVSVLAKRLALQGDTTSYNANFFAFLGVPQLSLWWVINHLDMLRKDVITGQKSSEYFDFKLIERYKDETCGPVYRITFKPSSTSYKAFSGMANRSNFRSPMWRYFVGEMLVSESDYAILNVKYSQGIPVEGAKEGLEKDYHSPYWKLDQLPKIVPSSLTFNDEYSYTKDTATGKYFVNTIKFDCHETGYQIETNRPVQLYYKVDVNSLGVENVQLATH